MVLSYVLNGVLTIKIMGKQTIDKWWLIGYEVLGWEYLGYSGAFLEP